MAYLTPLIAAADWAGIETETSATTLADADIDEDAETLKDAFLIALAETETVDSAANGTIAMAYRIDETDAVEMAETETRGSKEPRE